MYIYQRPDWPQWRWDHERLTAQISRVRHRQGHLIGRATGVGFPLRREAQLEVFALDLIKSNEIEGNKLDTHEVRSSIAKRLGIELGGLSPTTHYMDGLVEMMIDATQNAEREITQERLFGWHSCLFPTGRSGMHQITVGAWRTDQDGPMQVVSGGMGRERVHFEAPPAAHLSAEMERCVRWLNLSEVEPLLKSALAHLWFVTIHPFDDGNGRIARALSDLLLTRSDQVPFRLYSLSAQIEKEKQAYYRELEMAQRGDLDVTSWLVWYLSCVENALIHSDVLLDKIFTRAHFWSVHRGVILNERQQKMLTLLLDDFIGKLQTSKWAKICKCSHDTASRDIRELIQLGLLEREEAGGRSTAYRLVLPPSPMSDAGLR